MVARYRALERAGRRLRLFVAGLVTVAPGGAPQAGTTPAHVALVIGNSIYSAMPALPGCRVSAHSIAAALQRAGFAVTERYDLSNGEMSGVAADLVGQVAGAPGGTAVVYVCGYAVTYGGRNFLLPTSANLERDTDALTQGILATSFRSALGRNGASALVLLDTVASPNAGSASLQTTALQPMPGIASAIALEGSATAATPFATAIARALDQSSAPGMSEANAILSEIGRTLAQTPGVKLSMEASPTPVYLAGRPAPPAGAGAVTTGSESPVRASEANAPQAGGSAARPAAAPALPDEEHMTEDDRRRVQTALAHLGYYDGKIDGIFGPDTRAAIRRFQHEIGAPMTGRLAAGQADTLLARG